MFFQFRHTFHEEDAKRHLNHVFLDQPPFNRAFLSCSKLLLLPNYLHHLIIMQPKCSVCFDNLCIPETPAVVTDCGQHSLSQYFPLYLHYFLKVTSSAGTAVTPSFGDLVPVPSSVTMRRRCEDATSVTSPYPWPKSTPLILRL